MAASIRSTGYKGRLPRALAGLPPLPLDRVPGPWMRLPSRFDRDAAGLQPHAQCAAIRGALDPRPGLPPACHHVRLRVAEAVAMARRDQRVFRPGGGDEARIGGIRSEEHTSELQSLMRISYAVFCLKK